MRLKGQLKTEKVLHGKIAHSLEKVYPSLQKKSVIPQPYEQIVKPDSGFYGLSEVDVEAIDVDLQEKVVTPTGETFDVEPDFPSIGLSKVTIEGDDNLVSENIRLGTTIYGVLGSLKDKILDVLSITSSKEYQEFTPPEGIDGFSKVEVSPYVLNNQSKNIEPDGSEIEVTPDNGYDGLDKVTIGGEPNLLSENIMNGIDIYGTVGNHKDKVLEPLEATSSKTLQEISPPTGVDGFDNVTIQPYVLNNQTKTTTPNGTEIHIAPDTGYDGLNEVVVNGDSNLIANNIRKDTEIYGVTGTLKDKILTDLETTSSKELQIFNPEDNSVDGYDMVTINPYVLNNQSKTVTANEDMVVTPDEGYDGLDKVTVYEPEDKVHELRFFDIEPLNNPVDSNLPNLISATKYRTGENGVFPEPPMREYLEFVEWSHIQEEINNLQYRPSERGEKYMPGHIDIGAVYKCIDNITHMWANPNDGGGKTILIYFSKVTANVWLNIDWGDGTSVERFNLTGATITKNHTYTIVGEKHIQIWSDDGVIYGLGNGATNSQISTTGSNLITKVYIADNVNLKAYAFYNLLNLKAVSLPRPITFSELGNNMFYSINELKHLTIPRGYTTIPNAFLYSNTGLLSIVIPFTITTLGTSQSMYLTPALERVVFPPGITEIPNTFFDLGSTQQLVSDIITTVGTNMFNSYYLAKHFNLAMKIDAAGGSFMTNGFSLFLEDLEINFTGTCNNITWGQCIFGEFIIGSEVNICPGISNFNNINTLRLRDNITSINASITNKNIEKYIFESITPPTIANANFLSGLSRIATIYVPDESVSAYKTALNWTTVANYIKPMSEL